ncbi:hypothetical protein ROLI_020050 [Roseobacter fucihabitans]|uniref:Transposase n=1 Tax=Roseobacter fucihabitans TaxID=1537242 RepID=A0ABZ2BSV5_9RHOB|nr:hypothetical protein [Roseobacter litoralis]
MKARFTDEQIIAMIKEQEAGEKTADVCRRHALPGRRLRSNPQCDLSWQPCGNLSCGFLSKMGFAAVSERQTRIISIYRVAMKQRPARPRHVLHPA